MAALRDSHLQCIAEKPDGLPAIFAARK